MLENVQTNSPILTGDTVAYSHSYIERQSLHRDNLMYASGKVLAVHRIADGAVLADIDWDTAGLPKRVFVKDLIKV